MRLSLTIVMDFSSLVVVPVLADSLFLSLELFTN